MNQNESIKKVNDYFSKYKIRKKAEDEERRKQLLALKECISFKSTIVMNTFKNYSASNLSELDVIYYPLDIETIQEKVKNCYEVIFDDTSNKFYEVRSRLNNVLLFQYVLLLPKKDTLEPIVIFILRLCSDELLYNELCTGIVKEKSHGVYLKRINDFSDIDKIRPEHSRSYDLTDVSIDEEICNKYMKDKMLNTRVEIYLKEECYTTQNRFKIITEQIVEETLDMLSHLDIGNIYTNDIYLTKGMHIMVTGKEQMDVIQCNVRDVKCDRYIGQIPVKILVTKIQINYLLKETPYKETQYKVEYIKYSSFKSENYLSEFIS